MIRFWSGVGKLALRRPEFGRDSWTGFDRGRLERKCGSVEARSRRRSPDVLADLFDVRRDFGGQERVQARKIDRTTDKGVVYLRNAMPLGAIHQHSSRDGQVGDEGLKPVVLLERPEAHQHVHALGQRQRDGLAVVVERDRRSVNGSPVVLGLAVRQHGKFDMP